MEVFFLKLNIQPAIGGLIWAFFAKISVFEQKSRLISFVNKENDFDLIYNFAKTVSNLKFFCIMIEKILFYVERNFGNYQIFLSMLSIEAKLNKIQLVNFSTFKA